MLAGDGLWLMPGVVDCHLHVGLSSFDALELLHTPYSRRVLETAQVLSKTLKAGVTFVRDAGIADAGVRDAVAAGLVPGPSMQVSVVAIGSSGGHLDGFLSGPGLECSVDYSLPDYPGRPPHLADGPEEMRKVVRLVLRAGADWIKLVATRGVLAGSEGGFDAELSFDEIATAVVEARRRHRPVMVHALGGQAIAWAVGAGARSIEHGVFLSEAGRGRHGRERLHARADTCHLRASRRLGTGGCPRGRPGRTCPRGRLSPRRSCADRSGGGRESRPRERLRPPRRPRRQPLRDFLALPGGDEHRRSAAGGYDCGGRALRVGRRRGRIAVGYDFDAIVFDREPGDPAVFCDPATVTGVFQGGRPVLAHPRLGDAAAKNS